MEKEYIRQAAAAARELMETAEMKSGQILVVGCSSSEVESYRLGTHSSEETGKELFEAIYGETQKRGVFLAAQCCEHLNRALVVERAACERFMLDEVNVVPQPKAGGSFATTAYRRFADPVAVDSLKQSASAGMDVGGTLIGMHIKPVVVPLRIEVKHIAKRFFSVHAAGRNSWAAAAQYITKNFCEEYMELKAVFFDLD